MRISASSHEAERRPGPSHHNNCKGDERTWMPLFQDGVALLPELTERLDFSHDGPL